MIVLRPADSPCHPRPRNSIHRKKVKLNKPAGGTPVPTLKADVNRMAAQRREYFWRQPAEMHCTPARMKTRHIGGMMIYTNNIQFVRE